MTALEHIEAAEMLLFSSDARLTAEGIDFHLRAAELRLDLARLEKPNLAAETIHDLKPLLVKFLTPPEYIPGGLVLMEPRDWPGELTPHAFRQAATADPGWCKCGFMRGQVPHDEVPDAAQGGEK